MTLLEPESPMLAALQEVPLNPRVRMNSIIGTGAGPLDEPGDGVVTVESARQAGVESEWYVPAKHREIHHHPAAVAELLRILRAHAAAFHDGDCTVPAR